MDETLKTIAIVLTFILPPLINWFANAMPTDRASLGFLAAAVLSAILAYLQRYQEMKKLKKEKTK